jgi:Ca2+/H+ antiporter
LPLGKALGLQRDFVKGSKFLLIILSILVLPLMLFALYSSYRYVSFPDADLRHEELYIVAFMVFYSALLFVPYIITLLVKWRTHSTKLKLATLMPFGLMFLFGVFAQLNGVPW